MIILKKPNVGKIVDILKKGGLVVMPTETTYGAMVDATNPKAVEKLNLYKKRPLGKPYSVAVSDIKMAKGYVILNNEAKKLYNKFLPGPMTIISKSKKKVCSHVESENGTLGIRIPDYKLVIDVIKKLGKPITATSANASYKRRPYKISHILDNISQKQKNLIDLIVDVGTLPKREPSTVVDTTYDDPLVLRQGDIKLKNKNEVFSKNEENTKNIAKELWQKHEDFAGKRSIIFALEGEMGAGKTVFVKGLAKAMGIQQQIISSTYDLLSTYNLQPTNYNLVHIDTWRMFDPKEETKSLEIEKLIKQKNVLAIEWADKIQEFIRTFSEDAIIIWVKINYGKKEDERLISWGTL